MTIPRFEPHPPLAQNARSIGRIGTPWLLLAMLGVGCGGPAQQTASPATPAADEDEAVVVVGGAPSEPQLPPPPNVRVNQVGYLPRLPKHAVLLTPAKDPQKWELVNESGQVLATGQTKPFGDDADSGDHVHQIDFSAHQQPGKNLELRVGSDESYPFDIADDIYQTLKYDALWYFYHNRSGIEIALPYAGKQEWTRPAGHLSDKSVPCAKDAGCTYSLDVSGGWYDAGDHGKYVVNGGISVWTMQNQYERMQHLAPAALADFDDGKLRIPESSNQRNDLLDEARWEVEWLIKMQVPEGNDKAGMAHHKMHDVQWSGIGFRPPTDAAAAKTERFLRPVSTAATLNVAAAAAQAARLWKKLDPEFSKKCLNAAERAWKAAEKFPSIFAPASDKVGGGPYDDTNVDDEFYWAAAELFITTSKPEYKKFIKASPHYLKLPQTSGKDGGGVPSAMTWQLVSGLGTLSLAIVPNQLERADVEQAKKAITATADRYLALIDEQGYRTPMATEGGKYPWGSNSFVANNMVIMGLSHDFTQDAKYLAGVLDGMNYLLGVNAMGQSYVTGYGQRALQNPHHRFWAFQKSDVFPKPPPGCLSGGPNSSIQDPVAQTKLQGCKPQKCFIDHIDSWSTNEITINWNTPLAWTAAFLDEKAKGAAAPPTKKQ
jgi:endoglucanase